MGLDNGWTAGQIGEIQGEIGMLKGSFSAIESSLKEIKEETKEIRKDVSDVKVSCKVVPEIKNTLEEHLKDHVNSGLNWLSNRRLFLLVLIVSSVVGAMAGGAVGNGSGKLLDLFIKLF